MTNEELIQAAAEVRLKAYAPYSGYQVGAAIECSDGTVFSGCNIENSSYGLSMCAERVAVFKAISVGRRDFRRIAVIADSHSPVRPCGACRQVLSELFPPEAEVIMASPRGQTEIASVSALLPYPFDRSYL